MATIRTCSHIKVNGTKCGSPALRHNTLCYFHYRWQKRTQRMMRSNKTGIELPIIENHESMLLAIMEIQAALLDARIDRKTASTLLYSLQISLQSKLKFSGLCDTQSVRECPELEYELDCERVKGLRPAKEKCDACPTRDTCLSSKSCRKLPKPTRNPIRHAEEPSDNFCHAEERRDEASLSTPQTSAPTTPQPVPGTAPATNLTVSAADPGSLREGSPARECGVSIAKKPPSRAPRDASYRSAGGSPATLKLETRNSKLINTLMPNTIQSIDLGAAAIVVADDLAVTRGEDDGNRRSIIPNIFDLFVLPLALAVSLGLRSYRKKCQSECEKQERQPTTLHEAPPDNRATILTEKLSSGKRRCRDHRSSSFGFGLALQNRNLARNTSSLTEPRT